MSHIRVLAITLIAALVAAATPSAAQQSPPTPVPMQAQDYKSPFAEPAWQHPANSLGNASDADIWRRAHDGTTGYVSIPDKRAGMLIQTRGSEWRARHNGPLISYGAWALAGIVAVLALFFALRGRIRIDSPRTGRQILRFKLIERTTHWLTAGSFIVLALTGLNLLFGKHWLMPLIGRDAFAAISAAGKLTHNWIAWAFMLGLLMMLVLWARDNIWDRYDWRWIRQGGGLLRKGVHPPAGKFNFGQKVVFWAVILGGAAVSATGLSLLFPFFTDITGLQIMQLLHAIAALALTVLILAHIYIGSIGMEGAFEAMSSGMVDEAWAREHHSAWLAEQRGERPPTPRPGAGGLGPQAAE